MYSIYRLNASELDSKLIESVKALYEGKDLEIIIAAVQDSDNDEQKKSISNAIQESVYS
jgi:hypothetical protein